MDLAKYNEMVDASSVYPRENLYVYPALGLGGEAGEVQEKIKKWLRGDGDLDKVLVAKELGDVTWYVTALARDLGYTLEDILQMNYDKIMSRKERGALKGDGDER